jgi:hypothetical protein
MAPTKQKREIIVLVVLVVVAGFVWYHFFGASHNSVTALFPSGNFEPMNVEDYSKQLHELDQARATQYKASGRNIFVAHAAPPPNAIAAQVPRKEPFNPVGPQLPPPPPKPELEMKFFGLGNLPSRRAFLQDGEDVRIVGEGDTVKNHIRITHIGNDRIEFEDINTGAKNTANLEMPPPPA